MSVTELDDPWFAATQPSKRPRWIRNTARDVCDHNRLRIVEHDGSVIGPDPLFHLECECGDYLALQVGAPSSTGHALPDSDLGRAIRAVHLGRLRHGKGMR